MEPHPLFLEVQLLTLVVAVEALLTAVLLAQAAQAAVVMLALGLGNRMVQMEPLILAEVVVALLILEKTVAQAALES